MGKREIPQKLRYDHAGQLILCDNEKYPLKDMYVADVRGFSTLNRLYGGDGAVEVMDAIGNRLVDSYNALSGRDPAKLEGYIKAADALEAAADKLSENALTNGDETATELFIKLDFAIGEYNVAKAALAAFEKGEGTDAIS